MLESLLIKLHPFKNSFKNSLFLEITSDGCFSRYHERLNFKSCIFQKQHPELFSKKNVLRNFAKFTAKHLRQGLIFKKVAGLRIATLSKKRHWHMCFPVNFAKFLRTSFLTEHLRWLLLIYENFSIRITKTPIHHTQS